MILWISTILVVAACLIIGVIVARQRQKLDFSAMVGILLALLGLILGCGIAVQQYLDQQRDAQISARQDALALALTDTLAQIYRELMRTDLSPEAKRARVRPLIERYNRLRAAIAQLAGTAPPPVLALPQEATEPPATGGSTDAGPTSTDRAGPVGSTGSGGAGTATVPPAPPPPPPPPP